jgi:hypothetical protein
MPAFRSIAVLSLLCWCVPGTSHAALGTYGPYRFVPVPSCRIADTRTAPGTFGGPSIAAGTQRDFPISQGRCGIPVAARAYSLNLTVAPHAALSYLTVWPAGQPRPAVSTLNSLDGRVKANAAVVAAGPVGSGISAYATGVTDLIIDVNGYFITAASSAGDAGLAYYANPQLSTPLAATLTPLLIRAGSSRSLGSLVADDKVGMDVRAAALLIHATPAGASLGYLAVWPTGQPRPAVSTLNSPTGAAVTNLAIVSLGANSSADIYATHDVYVSIEVLGYFAPAKPSAAWPPLSFYTVDPCRLADTRLDGGSPLMPLESRLFPLASSNGCTAGPGALAVSANVTLIPTAPLGWMSMQVLEILQPLYALFSAPDGAVTSMAVIDGGLTYAEGMPKLPMMTSADTHVIIDLTGYFAP